MYTYTQAINNKGVYTVANRVISQYSYVHYPYIHIYKHSEKACSDTHTSRAHTHTPLGVASAAIAANLFPALKYF